MIRNNAPELDSLNCGVLVIGSDRTVRFCNKHVAQTYSKTTESLVGQPIETLVTPASKIFIDSYVYPLLFQESRAEEVQLNLAVKKGKRIPVVANIAVNKDKSTTWTFMACPSRNTLYEELLSTRDYLGDKTSQLETINKKIENERQELLVFNRSLSHDFNGPMSRARQMLNMTIDGLEGKNINLKEELDILNMVSDDMSLLVSLTQGLLEYLVSDSQTPQKETVDLNTVVKSAVRLIESGSGIKNKIVTGELPRVLGSVDQLQIVFKNLIGNALKFNNQNPVVTIEPIGSSKDGYATIAIRDNGIGIEPKQLDAIFKPFSRLHSQDVYEGSGLGLSIVKKLIEKNGGSIEVKSTLGEGSTFLLTLPLLS